MRLAAAAVGVVLYAAMKRPTCQQCAVKHISQARSWLASVNPWSPEALAFGLGHLDQARDELLKDLPELAWMLTGCVDTVLAGVGLPSWCRDAMLNLGSARALFLEYLSGYSEHLVWSLGKLAEAESCLAPVRQRAANELRRRRLDIERDATQPVNWASMAALCFETSDVPHYALRRVAIPDFAVLVTRVTSAANRRQNARWRADMSALQAAGVGQLQEDLRGRRNTHRRTSSRR
jgi:hypothetical protein